MKKTIRLALLFAVIILLSGEVAFEREIDITTVDVLIALVFGGLAAIVQQSALPTRTTQQP